jgi:pimeloyl-ACP methyl ester carboxylesterase
MRLLATVLAAVLTGGMITIAPASADADQRSYSGTIDGAAFRVEVPRRWNGTLMLYSHPYFTPDVPAGIGLANRPETETWLLEHGYALAGSDFKGRDGAVYEQAPRDQTALLDWFTAHVGRPRHTIATGSSMGAALSIMLAERFPDRFSGAAAFCGPLDLNGSWNLSLDVTFAIKTLLAPEASVVHAPDPFGSAQALQQAVDTALGSEPGRARVALASALGNVDGWNSALSAAPTSLEDRIRAQAAVDAMHIWVFGPIGRVDLEQRAGGNPSSNTGIDYRHQLALSTQRDLVHAAYRTAGLDLDRDLAQLAAAPRIAADPVAADWLHRFGVPRGTTPTPVITLHNVADPAVPEHERWYAGQVRRSGSPTQLRQLYTNRATHCAFTAAEEIVTLQALFTKIDTARWPDTSSSGLNRAAGELGPSYQLVYDFPTNQHAPAQPAFTRYAPPVPLRPSR